MAQNGSSIQPHISAGRTASSKALKRISPARLMVRQPAHRPLRQQAGGHRRGHEHRRLGRAHAVLGPVDSGQAIERAGHIARHEQHRHGQRHAAHEESDVQRRGQRRGRVRTRRDGDRHQAQHQAHGDQRQRPQVQRRIGRQRQLAQHGAQAGHYHVDGEHAPALMVLGLFVQPAFDDHELGHHDDAGDHAERQPQRQRVDQRLRQDHAGGDRRAGHEGADVAHPDDQPVPQSGAAHQAEVVAGDQGADPHLADRLRRQPQPHVGIEQARADEHQQGREVQRRERGNGGDHGIGQPRPAAFRRTAPAARRKTVERKRIRPATAWWPRR